MNAVIRKLSCKNFRSYRTLSLNFSSDFVVFYGENGAGKTNILEALSLFSSNRGLRKAPISDLGTISSPPLSWNLELTVERNGCKTFLDTNVQNGRRVAKIDGVLMPSLSKFDETLWLLWVIPSMNNIFISSQSDKRNFFDHLVSGYYFPHKTNLKELNNLQKERLHVIFHRKDEVWLRILEEKIAEKNALITKARLEFLELLHDTFNRYPSDFLRPVLNIAGVIESIYETCGEENAAFEIANRLKASRNEDTEKQMTTVSSLKTAWKVQHRRTSLEAENCSTGEQKAFLISIILAAVRLYKTRRNGIPALLLDDLMIHLDKNRRKSLINELKTLNVQSFFTGSELSLFSDVFNIAQIYNVKNSICSME